MKNNIINLSTLFLLLLTFTNCSKNEGDNQDSIDLTNPTIRINSPLIDFDYSTDTGNSYVKYRANFKAYSYDDRGLEKFQLTIKNSDGDIVLESQQDGNKVSEYEILDLSESFESTTPDTFTAVFTAIDANGNSTYETIIFTYSD